MSNKCDIILFGLRWEFYINWCVQMEKLLKVYHKTTTTVYYYVINAIIILKLQQKKFLFKKICLHCNFYFRVSLLFFSIMRWILVCNYIIYNFSINIVDSAHDYYNYFCFFNFIIKSYYVFCCIGVWSKQLDKMMENIEHRLQFQYKMLKLLMVDIIQIMMVDINQLMMEGKE